MKVSKLSDWSVWLPLGFIGETHHLYSKQHFETYVDGRVLTTLAILQLAQKFDMTISKTELGGGLLLHRGAEVWKVRCLGEESVDFQLSKHKGIGRYPNEEERKQHEEELTGYLVFDGEQVAKGRNSPVYVVTDPPPTVSRSDFFQALMQEEFVFSV